MTTPVLDLAFAALSDPTRREIVQRLAKGASRVTDLAEPFDMSFNAVSKHVKVLERAGLVQRTRAGREHRTALDPEPVRRIAGWAPHYERFWSDRLDKLEAFLKTNKRRDCDAYCRNENRPRPPDHGPPPDRSLARRGLRRVGRTRPVQALVRAAPGHSPQGRGRRALVLGGGPCRSSVGALLPLSARGPPAAVGVRVDVGSDARARVPGDHRDDAVPRRHGSDIDAQRAPRRRDGPRPRGGLEALHRHPGREDQRAAVRTPEGRREER